MYPKSPKNDHKYHWTQHVAQKMHYYQISESIIKRIIRFPKRFEEGIAPDTFAVMQSTTSKKNPQEIWVMYQARSQGSSAKNQSSTNISIYNTKKIIISAWRYPGISPLGKPIQIPDDVLADLADTVTL